MPRGEATHFPAAKPSSCRLRRGARYRSCSPENHASRRLGRFVGMAASRSGEQPAEVAAGAVEEFRRAYGDLGGTGTPRVVALFYFSLGDEHTEESLRNLRTYYKVLPEWVEAIAHGAARSEEDLRARLKAYQDAGVDELILDPSVSKLDQIDRVADVVFD